MRAVIGGDMIVVIVAIVIIAITFVVMVQDVRDVLSQVFCDDCRTVSSAAKYMRKMSLCGSDCLPRKYE